MLHPNALFVQQSTIYLQLSHVCQLAAPQGGTIRHHGTMAGVHGAVSLSAFVSIEGLALNWLEYLSVVALLVMLVSTRRPITAKRISAKDAYARRGCARLVTGRAFYT